MAKSKKNEIWLAPDNLTRIQGWAREGLTDAQLAQRMGIGVSTLRRWRRGCPEIEEAVAKGRAPVDIEAENALLKAALGYTVTVKKPFKVKEVTQKNGEGRTEAEHIEYAEEEVHVPAKITALIYWLKNRCPDKWRDRPQIAEGDGDDPLAEVLKRWDEGGG